MTGSNVTQAVGLFMGAANVSASGAPGGGNGDEFSQIMSRTTKDAAGQTQDFRQNGQAAAAKAPVKVDRSAIRDAENQETGKANAAEQSQDTAETAKDPEEAVAEAVSEVKEAIEEELDISEEELEVIMSELGLIAVDLLQPDNMQDIVVAAAGEGDGLSILTNGELYESVQILTGAVEEITGDLQEALDVDDAGFADLLQQFGEKEPVSEKATEIPVVVSQDEIMEQAPVREEETETVQPANEAEEIFTKTETVAVEEKRSGDAPAKEKESGTDRENNSHFLQGWSRNGIEIPRENIVADQPEISFETMNTRDVMDQVTEYMKVEVKPDTTELELRLHPETLGTLHIHLTAKEGVVTAQFTAENEAVRAVLEAQAMQLKENLNNQGVKVEAVEVTIASHGFERSFAENGSEDSGYEEPRKRNTRRIQLSDDISLDEMDLSEEERIAAEMMEQNGNTVDYMA